MIATVNITVGSSTFKADYVVGITRAPRAYDYHGVLQIEAPSREGGERIVALQPDDVPAQTARYASGMYFLRPIEDGTVDEGVLLDLVVARLFTSGE